MEAESNNVDFIYLVEDHNKDFNNPDDFNAHENLMQNIELDTQTSRLFTDDEDMTRIILSEEECNALETSGYVVLDRNCKKYLLDCEGIRELTQESNCMDSTCQTNVDEEYTCVENVQDNDLNKDIEIISNHDYSYENVTENIVSEFENIESRNNEENDKFGADELRNEIDSTNSFDDSPSGSKTREENKIFIAKNQQGKKIYGRIITYNSPTGSNISKDKLNELTTKIKASLRELLSSESLNILGLGYMNSEDDESAYSQNDESTTQNDDSDRNAHFNDIIPHADLKRSEDILKICEIKMVNGKKHFQCICCKKLFTRLLGYKKHLKVHLAETSGEIGASLKCHICSSCFTHQSTLTRHIVTIHRDEATVLVNE